MIHGTILIVILFAAFALKSGPIEAAQYKIHNNPKDYVLNKLQSHDLVMLGTRHKREPVLQFISDLIPALHNAGVTHIGLEICSDQQDKIDRFIKTGTGLNGIGIHPLIDFPSYRNLYAFMSQVIPFQDSDLEKLYSFIRFLLAKLPKRDTGSQYHFDDEVALKFYRLQKISEGNIQLEKGEDGEVSGPVDVGTGTVQGEKIQLSRLIDLLNERFGTQFKPGDQLFFDSIKEDAMADAELRQVALANPIEGFEYVFREALEGLFIDRMEQNEEITTKFLNEKEFKDLVSQHLLKQVYEQIRSEDKVI
jgi:hypothetical protein